MITEEIEQDWERVLDYLQEAIGKRPTDLNSVLFLVGVQELGNGAKFFTKEQKQDLMHVGICKVLSLSGYYQLSGTDQDGWPHWQLVRKLPYVDLLTQENLLKLHVVKYFSEYMGPLGSNEQV
ncbi:hypothetical protein [Larkinella soli]|uniref:hypothetical protein n=1 Tax=Larkinella soli TaxID=1770527 RepID=UPI000FFBB105|nr:hypothetical protein [Larkinella soli]